jgi:hypothetical protein
MDRRRQMNKLHYARDAEGKAVYAFFSARRCSQQAEIFDLVPVSAAEARKLYGKPTRGACDDMTWRMKVNGFVLPVSVAGTA